MRPDTVTHTVAPHFTNSLCLSSAASQLPFIQTLFTRGDNMPLIVPVMLGSASPALTDTLATALDAFRQIIVGTNNPRVLYVFSSDLAHFFDEREERGLDRTTLQRIAQGDALDLEAYFVELANKVRAPLPLVYTAGE